MDDQQIMYMAYWATIVFIGVFTALLSAMVTRWFFLDIFLPTLGRVVGFVFSKAVVLFRHLANRKKTVAA
ncbi:MAG: hypothetical protein WCH01_15875 [Methylococcaceae bacterium]